MPLVGVIGEPPCDLPYGQFYGRQLALRGFGLDVRIRFASS